MMVGNIDGLLKEIEEWLKLHLKDVYLIVFITNAK